MDQPSQSLDMENDWVLFFLFPSLLIAVSLYVGTRRLAKEALACTVNFLRFNCVPSLPGLQMNTRWTLAALFCRRPHFLLSLQHLLHWLCFVLFASIAEGSSSQRSGGGWVFSSTLAQCVSVSVAQRRVVASQEA